MSAGFTPFHALEHYVDNQQIRIPVVENLLIFGSSYDKSIERIGMNFQVVQPDLNQGKTFPKQKFTILNEAPNQRYSVSVIAGTKFRELNRYYLASALSKVAYPGSVIIVCENSLGPDSFKRDLIEIVPKLYNSLQIESKYHCKIINIQVKQAEDIDQEVLSDWLKLGPVKVNPDDKKYYSLGGFSKDELDIGSALLIENLPQLRGKGADLGAGNGVLSAAALRKSAFITNIDLYETNNWSIEAAKKNLGGFASRAKYHWHDVTLGLIDKDYDFIIMNPPFHVGQNTAPELGLKFIEIALKSLKMEGNLYFVANSHLPYASALDNYPTKVKLADKDGFTVWHVTKK